MVVNSSTVSCGST